MRASHTVAKVPMTDRGYALFTRVDLILSRELPTLSELAEKHDKIGKEFDYWPFIIRSYSFTLLAVSLATRQLRGLGGGINRRPTAGETG